MTFGMDVGWRRRAVGELRLPGDALVADLACGTGDLCDELLASGYRAVGFDFSHGMLRNARTEAPVVEADVLRLPLADGGVDGATCGFALRNVTDLIELFAETARVLRPGGRVAFLETSEPDGRVLRAGHALYFRRIVPLIGGALSDWDAYRYLPRSTAYIPENDRRLECDPAGSGVRPARRVSGGRLLPRTLRARARDERRGRPGRCRGRTRTHP